MPHARPDQLFESEGWDFLASKLISMTISLGNEDKELLRLRKEMELMRHVMHRQLMEFNGNNSIETSLYVGTVKAVSRIERSLAKKGITSNEFIMFMKMLLGRMKKQKLLVRKPLETRQEFGKMKKVIEDADSL